MGGHLKVYSQEINSDKKYSIKLYRTDELKSFTSAIIEGSYFLNKKIEVGLYFGYDHNNGKIHLGNTINEDYTYNSFRTGINTKYYFLRNTYLIRPYISGIVGLSSFKRQYTQLPQNSGTNFDCGIYGGLKSRIYKSLSLFAEGGFGDLGTLHFGISLDL